MPSLETLRYHPAATAPTLAPSVQPGDVVESRRQEEESRRFSEPGLFLVRRDGTLHYAAGNSMPFGRPTPKDVLAAMEFILDEEYPARGRIAA